MEIHHHPAGKQYRSHTILLCPQPPHQQPCRTQHQRQERRKTQQTRLVHHLQDMVMQIEGLVEEGLHRGQQTLRSAQAVPVNGDCVNRVQPSLRYCTRSRKLRS